MALKAQIARGLKWQAINIGGRQVLSLVIFTTLARLLDPSAFGLMGLVLVYYSFVSMFAEQGIGAALIQKKDLDVSHLDTAFWFNLGCGGILCLGTLLFAHLVAVMLNEPSLAPLLRWASLSLVLGSLSTIHSTIFIREMDFRRPVIRTLTANAVGGVVAIAMAFAGYGVWALVGQQLITALTGAIFLWSVSTYRPSFRFSLPHLHDLFKVSSSVFASGFLWFLSSRLDQIIIGRFVGAPVLGLYVIASKLPEFAKLVALTPIAEVSLPALSKLQTNYEKMRAAIYHGMELNALIAFAVFGGIAAVAIDLVPFVFGSKWAEAGEVCSLLSIYTLITTLAVFFHPALLASGGAGGYVFINLCHTAGVLVVSLVGIRFGISYLVGGLILNGLIVAFPALLFLRHRIGLSPIAYCRPCIIPALASLMMFLAIWAVTFAISPSIILGARLMIKIAVGALVYVAIIYFLKRRLLEQLVETALHAVGRRTSTTSNSTI